MVNDTLYRFLNASDQKWMFIGSVAAIVNGLLIPVSSFLIGGIVDQFQVGLVSTSQMISTVASYTLLLALVGIISFASNLTLQSSWRITGKNQATRFRKAYFAAVLKQDLAWIDKQKIDQIISNIITDCNTIQESISEKVPMLIMSVSILISGLIIAFFNGFKISLVALTSQILFLIGGVTFAVTFQKSEMESYRGRDMSGRHTLDRLSAIKTIKSLNGEQYELEQCQPHFTAAYRCVVKNGGVRGFGRGALFCAMLVSYAITLSYGASLIKNSQGLNKDQSYTAGDIIASFFSILFGVQQIGNIAPFTKEIKMGKQVANKISEIIDSVSQTNAGKKISNLKGQIKIQNVENVYPKAPCLSIHPQQKTVLVGEEDCSVQKSIMKQILGLSVSQPGQITLDTVDIKDLDQKWLRNQIGYFGKNNSLLYDHFTIKDNLSFGNSTATQAEMVEALKAANVWEFVGDLERKLDTLIIKNSFSNEVEQRICIAQILLKNPQILLLDEIDLYSDGIKGREFSQIFDKISEGKTTLIISNRQETIQNADKIYLFQDGEVIEEGIYSTLQQKKDGKLTKRLKETVISDHSEEQGTNQSNTSTESISTINSREQTNTLKNQEPEKLISDDLRDKRRLNFAEGKSLEKNKLLKKKEEQINREAQSRLEVLNSPVKFLCLAGILVSLINGTIFPFSGKIVGEFIAILLNPSDAEFSEKENRFFYSFILAGISMIVLQTLQSYLFTKAGESLTLLLRREIFQKVLKLPCSWFDLPENSAESTQLKIATDCQKLNILPTSAKGHKYYKYSAIISGLLMSLFASWQVALWGILMTILIKIGRNQLEKANQQFRKQDEKINKQASNIATSAISNIQTIFSFTIETKIIERFDNAFETEAEITNRSMIIGIISGLEASLRIAVYAVILYISAFLIRDKSVTVRGMYVSLFSLLFTAFCIQLDKNQIGNLEEAKKAARNVLNIIDSEDEVQQNLKLYNLPQQLKKVTGHIEFSNVSFKYPSSNNQFTLQNVSFKVSSKQKVAITGPNGSGKSTILYLLLRFYDDYTGKITIDGVDIRQYTAESLRYHFGAVFQDPIIFKQSFKQNIQYNTILHDLQEKEDLNQIVNLFQEKAQGYRVFQQSFGVVDSNLNNGDKKWIVIERVILRKPTIMLLDEPISGLDYQTEQEISQRLKRILDSSTSITFAERVRSSENFDATFVLNKKGQLVK